MNENTPPTYDGKSAPLRILIAEDDPVIGMLLAEMLTVLGHEVCGVEATPQGTVASALRLRPDLMIVDAKLKDGSGVDAAREILRDRKIPHVFMSGARILESVPGAPVLFKPFTEEALIRAIRQAMTGTVPQALSA